MTLVFKIFSLFSAVLAINLISPQSYAANRNGYPANEFGCSRDDGKCHQITYGIFGKIVNDSHCGSGSTEFTADGRCQQLNSCGLFLKFVDDENCGPNTFEVGPDGRCAEYNHKGRRVAPADPIDCVE